MVFNIINKPGGPGPRTSKLYQENMDGKELSNMVDRGLKVSLLRRKLALLVGRENCPVYDTIKAQHPHALEEPWSSDMSGPHQYVGKSTVPDG